MNGVERILQERTLALEQDREIRVAAKRQNDKERAAHRAGFHPSHPSPFMGDSQYSYHKNEERARRGNMTPCVICGRGIKEGKEAAWIRVVDGGSSFAPPRTPDTGAGEMGSFPIGASCLKKYRNFLKEGGYLDQ